MKPTFGGYHTYEINGRTITAYDNRLLNWVFGTVSTIHGTKNAGLWDLRWGTRRAIERVHALWCVVVGHATIPDHTRQYCVRCHRFIPRKRRSQ